MCILICTLQNIWIVITFCFRCTLYSRCAFQTSPMIALLMAHCSYVTFVVLFETYIINSFICPSEPVLAALLLANFLKVAWMLVEKIKTKALNQRFFSFEKKKKKKKAEEEEKSLRHYHYTYVHSYICILWSPNIYIGYSCTMWNQPIGRHYVANQFNCDI